MNKKVVVAFSGGLDTSYTVMKLKEEGYDVYAACVSYVGSLLYVRPHAENSQFKTTSCLYEETISKVYQHEIVNQYYPI